MLVNFINSTIERLKQNGVSEEEIERMAKRHTFSRYLPYRAYDPKDRYYINSDDTYGFLWEVIPLAYASKTTHDTIEQVLKTVPFGTVLQVILYADNNIAPIINRYLSLRKNGSEKVDTITRKTAELFMRASKEGFRNIAKIPARNFRCFVALKIKSKKEFKNDDRFLRDSVHEVLNGCGLNPRYMKPQALCMWLQRIFNDTRDLPTNWTYNDNIPINKQILIGGAQTNIKFDHIALGEKVVKIQTLKEYPTESLDDLTINQVMGGIWGQKEDGNQCNFPFMVSVNITIENMKNHFHGKTNMLMFQKKSGSTAGHKYDRQNELALAAREVDRGNRFVRVIPSIITFSANKEKANETAARMKRLWESAGFTVNNDRGILSPLFLVSLPFGLYNTKKNLDFLERDRIMTTEAAARMLPFQGDFSGIGEPVSIFLGRKGQVVPINLFNPDSPNQNALISATTGSGKSYLMNRIITDMRTTGAIVRVFDLGKSYKKLAEILGGNFIEFRKDSKICINPFTTIKDINEDIGILSLIISQMIWSSSGARPTETQMTIIKTATNQVFDDYGTDGNIDLVKKACQNFKHVLKSRDEISDPESIQTITSLAAELAFNLDDFTTRGPYGRWFNGKSTLNIDSDEFVVLELEELKTQEELFNVVVMQIVNYVTKNLYLSDRLNPRLIVFDEAWQWFKEGSFLGEVVENGYRLARKYYGSFITIFQSMLDLQKFGKSGAVLNENSAYKFLLMADYGKSQKEGLIDFQPFMMKILESVRLIKGRYSEVLIKTPNGTGVARLPADPFTHLVFTSDPRDNAKIDQLAAEEGISKIDAIEKMVSLAN